MFAQVDHPGLGLLMDPTNYFEAHNIDRMDQVLNQVFDTLTDRIRIAHAKDVKRSGSDKTEKHADIGDADAHEGLTFRGVGELLLPVGRQRSVAIVRPLRGVGFEGDRVPHEVEQHPL